MTQDEELLKEFLQETTEILERLDRDLVALEKDPGNTELLNAIFRAFHTTKGTAGFLGFSRLQDVTHAAESVLDRMRHGRMQAEGPVMDGILQVVDAIRRVLDGVRASGAEPAVDSDTLVARLRGFLNVGTAAAPAGPAPQRKSKARNAEEEDLIKEFLQEMAEILDKLDVDLVTLEKKRNDPETMNAIFRGFHTTKGTSGFLGFARMQKVAHAAEGVLDLMRSGKMAAEGPIMDEILAAVDFLRRLTAGVRDTGDESPLESDPLVDRLTAIRQGAPRSPAKAAKEPDRPGLRRLGKILIDQGLSPDTIEKALKIQKRTGLPMGQILIEERMATRNQVEKALKAQGRGRSIETEAEIRVGVGRLDTLMNLAGELVLCRNRLLQISRTMRGHTDRLDEAGRMDLETLSDVVTSLDLLTGDVQAAVMKTRMQPVGRVFGKFPRVVRDMARKLEKKIRLDVRGADTEVDRSIVEAISDPLVHIIRNACDHGIEMPQERKAAGKDAEGLIQMDAYHEGSSIAIRMSDDGKGIDAERIARKAVERGLVSQAEVEKMSHRDLLQLIFSPGFSTAEEVTDLSGRGVGMDVVKEGVERLNGSVTLESEPGRGTTILLKLPLTLAIVRSLMVEVAGETYAIPLANVVEVVKVRADQLQDVDGQEAVNLRDRVTPVLRLGRLFGVAGGEDGRGVWSMVVLSSSEKRLGLIVDRALSQEEIVIKGLGRMVRNTEAVAGATILGDGRAALILDVPGVIRLAARK